MKVIVTRFRTKNDVNGNPRRVYIAYHSETGQIIDARDEGYHGQPKLGLGMHQVDLPDIETTPKEYRRLLKYETGNVFAP